jgi:hypothetical protein
LIYTDRPTTAVTAAMSAAKKYLCIEIGQGTANCLAMVTIAGVA